MLVERWRPRRLARLRLAAGRANASNVAGSETAVQAPHSAARTQPIQPAGTPAFHARAPMTSVRTPNSDK